MTSTHTQIVENPDAAMAPCWEVPMIPPIPPRTESINPARPPCFLVAEESALAAKVLSNVFPEIAVLTIFVIDVAATSATISWSTLMSESTQLPIFRTAP